jgi:signal transduction histidine kinase
MDRADDLLVPFWLRTVRIGLLVTGLVLLVLAAFPFLPGHGRVEPAPYIAVLACAAAGAAAVAALPWRRLFERRAGVWFLYAWSAADIVLVSAAVAATGGGRSNLFLLYALTTVFFNASYPVPGQLSLLAFTFVAYLVALAATGWHAPTGILFLRLTSLGLLALLAGFLSLELMHQMRSHARTAAEAGRWARLLAAVTEASRHMTLDHDEVGEATLGAMIELGFDAAALCAVSEDATTYHVVRSVGMPKEYGQEAYPLSSGVTGRVASTGRTVVVTDYASESDALPVARGMGLGAVCATPIWIEGWLAAVLVAGTRERRELYTQEIQALELLAAQVGLALENVGRYEEQRHSVERLEELDRMKSDFLATVSHELRTPVTVIRGVGGTLAMAWDGLAEGTKRELALSLKGNAESLDAIIGSLLDFSRLESGQPDVNPVEFDIADLVRMAGRRLEPLLEGRPFVVHAGDALRVRADPALMDRVIENLVSNAAKHTPTGTRVELFARRDGAYAVIGVSDDGPGIPEDDLVRLGERFFRGGDLNERPKGLGLGLALAREMLEIHGSELEVESRLGEGSQFFFRLPLRDAVQMLARKSRKGVRRAQGSDRDAAART